MLAILSLSAPTIFAKNGRHSQPPMISQEGKVARYLINPFGEIGGLFLDDSTFASLSPHMSADIADLVKPGDAICSFRSARRRVGLRGALLRAGGCISGQGCDQARFFLVRAGLSNASLNSYGRRSAGKRLRSLPSNLAFNSSLVVMRAAECCKFQFLEQRMTPLKFVFTG